MYVVIVETPQPGQARHIHLHSYGGNITTRAGNTLVVVPLVSMET